MVQIAAAVEHDGVDSGLLGGPGEQLAHLGRLLGLRALEALLELAVGFSHPVTVKPRKGIEFDVPQPTQIVVKGIDKQMVGQTAAEIRKVRPPEPYKGKGIRYEGEFVRRKVGKRA